MKKILPLILILALISFAGCSGSGGSGTTDPALTAKTAAAKQTCISNRQTIAASLNTFVAGTTTGKPITAPFSFQITYDGETAKLVNVKGIEKSAIQGLFAVLPYCPDQGTITADVTFEVDGSPLVSVYCSYASHNE